MASDRRKGGGEEERLEKGDESTMRGKMLERVGEWKVRGRVWVWRGRRVLLK